MKSNLFGSFNSYKLHKQSTEVSAHLQQPYSILTNINFKSSFLDLKRYQRYRHRHTNKSKDCSELGAHFKFLTNWALPSSEPREKKKFSRVIFKGGRKALAVWSCGLLAWRSPGPLAPRASLCGRYNFYFLIFVFFWVKKKPSPAILPKRDAIMNTCNTITIFSFSRLCIDHML